MPRPPAPDRSCGLLSEVPKRGVKGWEEFPGACVLATQWTSQPMGLSRQPALLETSSPNYPSSSPLPFRCPSNLGRCNGGRVLAEEPDRFQTLGVCGS